MSTTRTFFDQYAEGFNAIYGNENTLVNRLVNKYLRRSMYTRYLKTLEGASPIADRTVADIGCGPGHYGVALAKAGAGHIYALDFAPGMVNLAKKNAEAAGVEGKFTFAHGDFLTHEFPEKYDYAVLMGFMDYMADPVSVIQKAMSIAKSKVFLRFPVDGGLLAFQRKLRYKFKCDLYMYTEGRIRDALAKAGAKRYEIEQIDRDYFVTIYVD